MAEAASRNFDNKSPFTYSVDLIDCLKTEIDSIELKQCLEHFKLLESQSAADFKFFKSSVQDYKEKIDLCKQKTDAAKSEVAADSELDMLQKELEAELRRESLLSDQLRVITNDIDDLEHQRVRVEERRQSWRKADKDDSRAQMKLSMYASVTNVIPKLDEQSTISGNMVVKREKKIVQHFKFDPLKLTSYDTCSSIWKIINSD